MNAAVAPIHAGPGDAPAMTPMRWLRTRPGTVALAGVLAFAGPVTFMTGSASVMREPSAAVYLVLAGWWSLYGGVLWAGLLVLGYASAWIERSPWALARQLLGWSGALLAVLLATLATAQRADVLIDQGIVQGAESMHLHASVLSWTMALLYVAHLHRSALHEHAAARLAIAQAAQREARRRAVQARMQAMQARIDPQLLFATLGDVRRSYAIDVERAERLLDELVAFLRLALPRLREDWSTVSREIELARSYMRLQALSIGEHGTRACEPCAGAALHARFPPGLLLPLLSGVPAKVAAHGELSAGASAAQCRVTLELSEPPDVQAADRVHALLGELYGSLAELSITARPQGCRLDIGVPHEAP